MCYLGWSDFLGHHLLAKLEYTLILVTVRENEPFEKALRRFRRKVEREGIRKDIKKNSFYLKPGEKRRLKTCLGGNQYSPLSQNIHNAVHLQPAVCHTCAH